MLATENLTDDANAGFSHRLFEWASLVLFIWFAATGMLLWRPGYYEYALLTGGVLLLWILFLFDDIGRGVNRVRSNTVYWIILPLCVILGGHLLADLYIPQVASSNLRGGINISMCYHLGLIAVAILLAQRLGDASRVGHIFPDAIAVVLALFGGVATAFVTNGPGRNSLWLIAASGVCIWLMPFIRSFSQRPCVHFHFSNLHAHDKVKLILRLLAGCCVAVLLLVTMNSFCLWVLLSCFLAVGLLLAVAWTGRAVYCWSAAILGGAIVFWILYALGQLQLCGVLGLGEKGFLHVFAGSSGVMILSATTGWAGVLIVIVGGLIIGSLSLLSVRRNSPDRLIPAGVWVLATFIASAAFLSPGGYVSLASVIALAITWGLWSRQLTGHPPKTRHPSGLLFVVLSFLGLVTVVSNPGLLTTMGVTCGLKDTGQHFLAGLLVTIIAAWVMGKRYWWLGLLGVVLAILLGGLAEWVQENFSFVRAMQMSDWKAHLRGGLVAGAIFVVALAYRHAMRMARQGSRKQKRLGRYLEMGLRIFVLLCILGFSAWWSSNVCRTIDHRLKTPVSTATISDVMMIPYGDKSRYLPGCTNDKDAVVTVSIITVLPGRKYPEIGRQTETKGFLRIMPVLKDITPGLERPGFQGLPFGPLAYVREKGVLVCVPIGKEVLAIDARDVEKWQKSQLETFNELLGKFSQDKAIVFIHPGPAEAFKRTREVIQRNYPDIPCICDVMFDSGARRTVAFLKGCLSLKGTAVPEVDILTSDIALAKEFHRYFSNKCHATVVIPHSSESATTQNSNKKNAWLNYSPDLETVVNR